MCLAAAVMSYGAALLAARPPHGPDAYHLRLVFSSHSAGVDPTVAGCAESGRPSSLEA